MTFPIKTKTFSVLADNNDNKLLQPQWSTFCSRIEKLINESSTTVVIHFKGHTDPSSFHRTFCIVFEVGFFNEIFDEEIKDLKSRLTRLRYLYGQDSVAFIEGKVELI